MAASGCCSSSSCSPLSTAINKLPCPRTSCTTTTTIAALRGPSFGAVPPTALAVGSTGRREWLTGISAVGLTLFCGASARAASDEEYVRETTDVIGKVRSTIGLDRADPNVAAAVEELREVSNGWVSKYRKEKSLLGRSSFRDVYSALNAVSGHYISFGPTAPIPAKRKARILEEVSTAEKALLRGR